jgi:hypothetical protein
MIPANILHPMASAGGVLRGTLLGLQLDVSERR